jgi:mono/diheme cytochrome c family protein
LAAIVLPLLVGGALLGRTIYLKRGAEENSAPRSTTTEPPKKATPVAKASEPARQEDPFSQTIHPLLSGYCVTCHNERKLAGGVSLEQFKDQATALADRKIWGAVAEVLRAKEMPPKGKPQPSETERAALLDWIDSSLTRVDCGLAKDPGRPTVRRLNKAEYNNTVRDLTGVNFQPADDFPSDDVGYGFDNIGDVLTLSPILFEKYLAAAEKILEQAIVDDKPIAPGKDSFRPQALRSNLGKPATPPRQRYSLFTNGKVYISFDFLHSGNYIIRARAYGEQAGNELPKMAFQIDGKAFGAVDVDALENKPKFYEMKTRIQAGRHDVELAFTNDFEDKKAADPKKRDRNLYIELLEIEGPFAAEPKPLPDSDKLIMIARPIGTADRQDCARKIIENFATRAYRRPVEGREVDRLLKFYREAMAESESFEQAIRLALQPVLVSPHFLFRIEKDPGPLNSRTVHPISEFELASRLSYFLWSSMPDAELFGLASKGRLRQPGVMEGQIQRLLASPKARALTDNFAAQWLNLRIIPSLEPDPKTFPKFDAALKAAMVTETELYFEHIAKEDRSVLEFLDSDWTFVNKRLAEHYGIEGVSSAYFQKVRLPNRARGGVIMQASVLTLTSNPTRTSPVKRGKWLLENILGTPPPPPPPNVPDLDEQQALLKGSLRQQMEQHRTNSLCASCHQKMDPLGFGLENFDGIGGWRTMDGTYDIDASGELPGGERFDGPAQLRRVLLAKADLFRRNIAEKMLTFALGRGLEHYDKCAIDEIAHYLTANNDRFSALVIGIVKSDPFQNRRGGGRE